MRYPVEELDEWDDDGTMVENVHELANAVVGHRIIQAEKSSKSYGAFSSWDTGLVLTLDNGNQVQLINTHDCCAYTELEAFLLHPEMVDHIITGVGTTEEYSKWHIYADMSDVLELTVGWSSGNPFFYGYGFDIAVVPVEVVAQ